MRLRNMLTNESDKAQELCKRIDLAYQWSRLTAVSTLEHDALLVTLFSAIKAALAKGLSPVHSIKITVEDKPC